jgi:hypothetical protein
MKYTFLTILVLCNNLLLGQVKIIKAHLIDNQIKFTCEIDDYGGMETPKYNIVKIDIFKMDTLLHASDFENVAINKLYNEKQIRIFEIEFEGSSHCLGMTIFNKQIFLDTIFYNVSGRSILEPQENIFEIKNVKPNLSKTCIAEFSFPFFNYLDATKSYFIEVDFRSIGTHAVSIFVLD